MNDVAEKIVRRALEGDRFARDYSGQWHFLVVTPDEHRELVKALGMDIPIQKFDPKAKKRKTRSDKKVLTKDDD